MSKAAALLLFALLCSGCRQDMFEQPKYRPLDRSQFFVDGRSARPVPANTYEYTAVDQVEAIERGTTNGSFIATIPVPVNEPLLKRGQQRFNIYCSPCHSRIGDGRGMIAKRGFIQPADLHSDRVRHAPPGYIFAVITNGFGAMPEYSTQIGVHDRWAIVAYIRALQLSRHASAADVPPDQRAALENAR